MRVLVSAHVDTMLPGVAEWYTKQHIKGCVQCQASLPFLSSLKDRLKVLDANSDGGALTEERLMAVENDLNKIDGQKTDH